MTASTSLSDKFGGLDNSGQMDVGARDILQQRSVDNSLELTEDGNVLFVVAGLWLAEGERIGMRQHLSFPCWIPGGPFWSQKPSLRTAVCFSSGTLAAQ